MKAPRRERGQRRRVISAEQAAEHPASRAFVLSCVDQPRPTDVLRPGMLLSGKGWAISEAPITSIAVHLGETFLCYASYGQPRPEIGREFAHYPQAHHSGFAFSVRLDPTIRHAGALADVQFRFRTARGGETRRHLALNWAEETAPLAAETVSRPWPIRLALEACRVDESGQLRLHGYAVTRTPLEFLSLYLDETRLHEAEIGLPRPDLASRYSGYAGAAQSGFRLVQDVDAPITSQSCIRAVAQAGGIQRQIIVPVVAEPTGRHLVQDGLVNLCCETLRVLPDRTIVIAGWAIGGAETREIEIRTPDGCVLGHAEIGLARPDIGNRFPRLPGSRHAGFRFRHPFGEAVPAALELTVRDTDGGERKLYLDLAGQRDGDRAGTTTEIVYSGIDAPALREGRATIAHHGPLTIAGWAVCRSGIASVELWREDIAIGSAHLGIRREDVAATHPDIPDALTSGFALTVPQHAIGDGEQTMRVLIRTREGTTVEEVFRLVAIDDDDRHGGAIRDHVPFAETRLRVELLDRFGPQPNFTVFVRQPSGADPERRLLASTLDSLRRQSFRLWRAVVLVGDAQAGAEISAAYAADPEIAGQVSVTHAGATVPLPWPAGSADSVDLFCLVHAGDRLGANALIEMAVEARLSGAEFVYADERCYDPVRHSVRPFHKPAWSPTLLQSTNYIGRAWCATRDLAERCDVGVLTMDRFGDYDTVLRLTEAARKISHVPLCLVERGGQRSEPPLREREALARAARREGQAAGVTPGRVAGTWRIRRRPPQGALVSIIIATCGARGLVRRCIASLRAHLGDTPVEIIVLDGMSSGQADLQCWVRANVDRMVPVSGPFNWSLLNNLGARAARGSFLLFLNDDIEVNDHGWLEAMLEHAQRPAVGAVGAQLLYPDGKVQHAGMFLRGANGIHAFRFAAADDPGPFGLASVQRDVTAVTGACLLFARTVFTELGGFNEQHTVIKNDLDFCLRIRQAGLLIVYTPYASLTHHEMASRAALDDSFDQVAFDSTWLVPQLLGDPFVSPNCSDTADDFRSESEPVQMLQPGLGLIDRGRVQRILVVKLDHIGDFICCLPAIDRLKAAFPAAHITLLAASASIALASLSPSIDHVIQFDFFSVRSINGRRAISEAELEGLAAHLRPLHFDIAVDFRMHAETRHVLRYTGAMLLAGFDDGGRFPWLDIVSEWEGDMQLVDKRTHVTASLLRLAGAIDDAAHGPAFMHTAPTQASGGVRTRLFKGVSAPPGFTARPLICVHPGAGTPLKQWPAESYSGLIRLLLDAYDVSVVLIGSADEEQIAAEVADAVQQAERVVSLAGKVTLADLSSLLSGCVLFVGNDSGPKHLAGALGIPTVGIHASHVDAAEWAPPGPRAIAIRRHMTCGPCYIAEESDCPRGVACLRGITPASVYRACRLLLGFTFGAGEKVSAASIVTAASGSAASAVTRLAAAPTGWMTAAG